MEIVIEFLKEFGVYLLTSAGVVLSVVLGRPKTAEKLEKKKQKQNQKLVKKGAKFATKAIEIYDRLNDEVNKNG